MSMTPLSVWRRILRRMGRTGVVATAMLATGLALLATLPHLKEQTRALDAAQAAQTERLARQSVVKPARQVPVRQQIDGFVAAFPLLTQHADDLRVVFNAAARQHLSLPRGEYQLRNDANAPLVTVSASFPVTAGYGTIKAFTAEVLKNAPNASLEELRMARDSAGSKTLESSIRFSFVYRRG